MSNLFVSFKRWFLLGLLLIFCFSFFYFDLQQYLSYETIKKYQFTAQQWTDQHYFYAVLLYLALFTILIACGIPCATLMTLVGGFLFGTVAVFYAVFATTLGGVILFIAVRTALGADITKRSSGWIKKMERGFQKNAFNYLLMFRLIPVFPCWISNISAGALNVPLRTFIFATILGIFPATFIYVMAGRGLDKIFSHDKPDFSLLFTPSILFPLIGLAIISLLPVFYKSVIKHNQNR